MDAYCISEYDINRKNTYHFNRLLSIASCRLSDLLSNGLVAAIVFNRLDLKLIKYNKIFSENVLNHLCKITTVLVPAMEMLVLIIQVYSKGSGEPAHLLSLISAFAIHLHRVWN